MNLLLGEGRSSSGYPTRCFGFEPIDVVSCNIPEPREDEIIPEIRRFFNPFCHEVQQKQTSVLVSVVHRPPRQAHSNGYLWDLTPGTSEALQVYCHHFLLFLLLHYFFHFFGKAVRSSRTNLTFDSG
ncbi:hypothetical protein EYF80_004958 [Liparis tanakae]|uniref:Uncharacterized protein n=1 Tax=Liparis tanakae TaxID=230148 RepID=A0A4Z2J5V5_9TELE|nr:hypothetical protein EYF80_004958 [Liparis tanakae]